MATPTPNLNHLRCTITNTTFDNIKKKSYFSLMCDDDEVELSSELSKNEIILAELKLYSTLKGSLNEHSCPLLFYKINEHQLVKFD